MLRKIELNGRQVEALVLDKFPASLRRAIEQYGTAPFVLIPDDGELVPALSTIARAYAIFARATAEARARVLGDRQKATRRADLTEKLLGDINSLAEDVAQLCVLDGVRNGLRELRELPEPLRPAVQEPTKTRRQRRASPAPEQASGQAEAPEA